MRLVLLLLIWYPFRPLRLMKLRRCMSVRAVPPGADAGRTIPVEAIVANPAQGPLIVGPSRTRVSDTLNPHDTAKKGQYDPISTCWTQRRPRRAVPGSFVCGPGQKTVILVHLAVLQT